jgi:hypothetical protein
MRARLHRQRMLERADKRLTTGGTAQMNQRGHDEREIKESAGGIR